MCNPLICQGLEEMVVLVIASLATGGAGDRVRKQQTAVPLYIQQHSGSAGWLVEVTIVVIRCAPDTL